MDYQTAFDFMEGLWSRKIDQSESSLEKEKKVLAHFGNPHLHVATIHIAGTNGKGSIAAYIESILRAANFRVGLFTSPYFFEFRETIQIDRVQISKSEFASTTSEVKKATEELGIEMTFYEFGTVLAFLYFSRKKLDWLVLEACLGGRYDCINVCDSEISILSSISLDHQEFLGHSIEKISEHKAAIIKKNGAVVIAEKQKKDAEKVILKTIDERKATIRIREKDYFVNRKEYGLQGQSFDFRSNLGKFESLKTKLLGIHQVFNAGVAIESILSLKDKGHVISKEAIPRGISNCQWEGRLEVIEENPFLVLDSAHNVDSVKFLTKGIKEHFKYKKCIIVFGVMADKDFENMGVILSEIADKIILTKPKTNRSADPVEIKKVLSKTQKPIEIIEEIPYSVKIAKKLANPEDLICVTGSLFTIAEAKLFLNNEKNS